MQAALLMNKLKAAGAGMAAADTSSLASVASGVMSMSSSEKKKASKASSSHLAMGDKLNKNTVASLLAKSRQQQLTSDELEQAERAWSRPELTIEPLFRGMKPEQRYIIFLLYSPDRIEMILASLDTTVQLPCYVLVCDKISSSSGAKNPKCPATAYD